MISLLKKRKEYTLEEKTYIMSKIPDMKWKNISDIIRDFWLEWKKKNEK
jgi:hypothetical protein